MQSGTRIGESVDSNSKPGHRVAAQNSNNTEGHNGAYLNRFEIHHAIKVEDDYRSDDGPKNGYEQPLTQEIGLTCFINQSETSSIDA